MTCDEIEATVREAAVAAINACYYDDRLGARAIRVHGENDPGCVAAVAREIASRVADKLTHLTLGPSEVAAIRACRLAGPQSQRSIARDALERITRGTP